MDIEKIIGSLLEQQAKSDAWVASFKAGMEELRQNHQATERLINAFANDGARRSNYTAPGWIAWSGGWKR